MKIDFVVPSRRRNSGVMLADMMTEQAQIAALDGRDHRVRPGKIEDTEGGFWLWFRFDVTGTGRSFREWDEWLHGLFGFVLASQQVDELTHPVLVEAEVARLLGDLRVAVSGVVTFGELAGWKVEVDGLSVGRVYPSRIGFVVGAGDGPVPDIVFGSPVDAVVWLVTGVTPDELERMREVVGS